MRWVAVACVSLAACGARSELSDLGSLTAPDASAPDAPIACSLPAATVLASGSLASGSTLPTVSAPHVQDGFVYWVVLADSSVHDFWTNDGPEQTATIYRVPAGGGAAQALAS